MLNLLVFLYCFSHLMVAFTAFGNVVLIGTNVTLLFEDMEANFAPPVKRSGQRGIFFMAEPSDACSLLTNKLAPKSDDTKSSMVLIIRGGCSFDAKVRRAQAAGFEAAIIYDNEYGDLIAMAGNSPGIKIQAVFVSKTSGEMLAKYAGSNDMELWIYPNPGNSAWSIMALSFISLLAMSAMLATCFFVRRHRIRRERPQAPRVREFHGMSSRLVKAMPSLIFTAVLEDNCTSATCAICLEDYNIGEKLRILPCGHKFHAICVDAWLTSWRTFCPVCKRDARTSTGKPPASESTPLLTSNPSSVASSASVLSSFGSPPTASPALQIGLPFSSRSPQTIYSTSHSRNSLHYHHQSPHLSASRSCASLRNMPSQVSRSPYLVSPHSLGYPSLPPLNSRYMSPYVPSPSNASSSYLGSSSHRANALHYSESATSLSPFASAQSLPGC